MTGSRRLLVATFNAGKLREITRLVGPLRLEVVSPVDVGIREPYGETGATYEENARGKAVHYAALSGLTTLADDSGIEVEALGGRPGPLSARYGGEDLDDAGRNRRLLDELAGVPDERRRARYVAVVAVAHASGVVESAHVFAGAGGSEASGAAANVRLFRDTCDGRIAPTPRGGRGFGYDPIFFFPPLDRTFGELDVDEKDRVSHRGRALRRAAAYLAGTVASGSAD